METLTVTRAGYGHFLISIEMDGKILRKTTTNTMAIDAAFDDNYDDDNNAQNRYYDSQSEAKNALAEEILDFHKY